MDHSTLTWLYRIWSGPPHFILIDLVQEELEEIEANRPRGKTDA